MRSVIIKVRDTALTDDGHFLLTMARQQDRHLAMLLQPRAGILYIEINNEGSDDILRIKVDDQLGHAERVRRFGGGTATPIAPEVQEQKFGLNAMSAATRRVWFVPQPLIDRAKRDPEHGAAILNAAGAALQGWCAEGGFTIWIDPDWIAQTAAAADVGVAATAIRNAVRDGRLVTWDDPREPNPQRRTRVRRSDVVRLWGQQHDATV